MRRLAPIFASIVAAVACGPRIDEDDFEDHCSDSFANVTLAPGVDGAHFVDESRRIHRIGEPCSKATSDPMKPPCPLELAHLVDTGSRLPVLVGTAGDRVIRIDAASGTARDILGTIDSATEARLAANVLGFPTACRVRARAQGFELYGTRSGDNCGSEVAFVLGVSREGVVQEVDSETLDSGDDSCSIGRRPAGLRRTTKQRGAGGWFADVARLEAASVVAFERLASELVLHGAPRALVRRALRAAKDERRHTRMMDALARRHGSRMRAPKVGPARRRSIEAMALENAREGCVRETYGALVATWQARTATDRSIARTMAIVAADETRHAELSWDVAEFLSTRLTPRSRARVERERVRTAQKLLVEAEREPQPMLVEIAGVPRARDARRLAGAFVRTLFA